VCGFQPAGERIGFLLRLSYLCIQLPCRFFQNEPWIPVNSRCGFSPPDAIRRATPGVERTIQGWPEKNSGEPEFVFNGWFGGVDTPMKLGCGILIGLLAAMIVQMGCGGASASSSSGGSGGPGGGGGTGGSGGNSSGETSVSEVQPRVHCRRRKSPLQTISFP
jgi:hypothetical protein